MRLCRELGTVLNDRQFTDVYAGTTLICTRSGFFACQIIFFAFVDKPESALLPTFCDPFSLPNFDLTVFVPTQLLNRLSKRVPVVIFGDKR